MNESSRLTTRLCLKLAVLLPPLFMLALAIQPAAAETGVIGNVCVGQYVSPANCTANDVRVREFFATEITESCAEGIPGEAVVVLEALISPNQCDRYGIGVFVNLDGETGAAACMTTWPRSLPTPTTGSRISSTEQ